MDMTRRRSLLLVRRLPATLVAAVLLLGAGCGQPVLAPEGAGAAGDLGALKASGGALPARGKQTLPAPPPVAAFGMIYVNATSGKEYIHDGAQWVPHDATVESFYGSRPAPRPAALLGSASALAEPCTSYACNPGGAHPRHAAFACTTCHMSHGPSRFDPNGPAVIRPSAGNPFPPVPTYAPTAKTCSNVACHAIPQGTFSYYFPGGDGEPELKTVSYGGPVAATPSWYAAGAGCAACHANPPPNGMWHGGRHAVNYGGTTCQFCHPGEAGSSNVGTAIVNAALHRNGTVEVQARFRTYCFDCH
jgi:hypothetical protein